MRQVMHGDRNGVESSPPPLLDRREHAVDEPVPGARQAQVRLARADGLGRQRDAVQHQVRRAGQQRLILLARRLALHAVRDHDGRPALRGDGAHLRPGREAGAAAPGQPGRRHLVEQAMPAAPGDVRERPVNGSVLAQRRGPVGVLPADREPAQLDAGAAPARWSCRGSCAVLVRRRPVSVRCVPPSWRAPVPS